MSRRITWKNRAACKNAPTDLFVTPDGEDEPFYPPEKAHAYCSMCPVKVECLQHALDHDEVGVWGDTTYYQRRQLNQDRERAKCPGCGSSALIYENKIQLCLGCGVSWPII